MYKTGRQSNKTLDRSLGLVFLAPCNRGIDFWIGHGLPLLVFHHISQSSKTFSPACSRAAQCNTTLLRVLQRFIESYSTSKNTIFFKRDYYCITLVTSQYLQTSTCAVRHHTPHTTPTSHSHPSPTPRPILCQDPHPPFSPLLYAFTVAAGFELAAAFCRRFAKAVALACLISVYNLSR